MSRSSKTKLAIFDLDGVLVHTHHIHTSALRKAVLECTANPEAAAAAYLDASNGERTVMKLTRLQLDFNLTDNDLQCIDAVKKRNALKQLATCQLNLVAVQGMKQLKENGYKIAIASNARRDFVIPIIKGIGILGYVDLVICGDDVSAPKPNPEIFMRAMEIMHAMPEDTYIWEDSVVGIAAAYAAGAHVIRVDPVVLVTQEQLSVPFQSA